MIVTAAALTSQINDFKNQLISDEVKKVDDKVTKNITDILTNKTSLEHNKSVTDHLERKASFNRRFHYYNQQSYFLFEPNSKSFTRNGEAIHTWLSTGIHNDSNDTDLFSCLMILTLLNKTNRLGVNFNGNYMKQNRLDYAHGKIVNLYIVYESKNRRIDNPDFTVQNGLFGAVQVAEEKKVIYWCKCLISLCFNNINRNNDIFLFKINE